MSNGWLIFWAVVAALVWLAFKWVQCLVKPFTDCRHCGGTGRNSRGKFYGYCWWCKGNPKRLRFGRKVLNKLGVVKKNLL